MIPFLVVAFIYLAVAADFWRAAKSEQRTIVQTAFCADCTWLANSRLVALPSHFCQRL